MREYGIIENGLVVIMVEKADHDAAMAAKDERIAELEKKYDDLSRSLTAEEVLELAGSSVSQKDGYKPSWIEQEFARRIQQLERDKAGLVELANNLDMHTIHTSRCFYNRKSLDECICGLGTHRKALRTHAASKGEG